ncbi:MAG: ABC transporter substrate-binding protein [Rhodomicrobium sp.]|nr:ABC transporter substrate-binding protein [Rhodomicrobium sp.]
MTEKITIGFIPLADATSLLAAADFGFAEAEGLQIELVREVSWANVREKLNAGIFDAAHLLAPMAVASALDVMPGSTPLMAPYVLALNGNAITVSEPLYHSIMARIDRAPVTPLATARALASIIVERKDSGKSPLVFGSTFPFSCHSYQLRFWMAAGGIDTAEDIRIVVLPPPYMVESLNSGEVDGFCVGAPWNSLAVNLGIGNILHFGCEIVQRLTEKVIAARTGWLHRNDEKMIRLMRAVSAAAVFASQPANWEACCERLSAKDRIGASPELIKRTLSGSLKVSPDGTVRTDDRYLMLGSGRRARPDAAQAAWFYSQMVRWGQAKLEPGLNEEAQAVLSPDLFDRAFPGADMAGEPGTPPADGLGTFEGPSFDKDRIADYLAASAAS